MLEINKIHNEDCLSGLKKLPDCSINCCVTSPPYYKLRDYGVDGQLGMEETPALYVQKLVEVFREVKRVLKDDGTLWLNLGDSYNGSGKASGRTRKNGIVPNMFGKQFSNISSVIPNKADIEGLKPKDLIGIPWMVAFALRADDWYLRSEIIWHKNNPMPESVTDRPTKAHEQIFLLSKNSKYYYDNEVIREPATYAGHSRGLSKNISTKGITNFGGSIEYASRNKRSVWSISTRSFRGAHFATFPPKLIEPCILAGCHENGIVLDPFMGAGTTAMVARKLGRNYIGFELNPEYIVMANNRIC